MTTIEQLAAQKIDPLNEREYREWSSKYNLALREAAPPQIKHTKHMVDSGMIVKNWSDLRRTFQRDAS